MSSIIDQLSISDPHPVQLATTNLSASSLNNQKVSIFGAKSGFVIPKNKLSGSLVPIFRSDKKLADNNAVHEENLKLVGRKTKWAPDLTLDAAVRKGRALAYQIRLDQITEQLKSGILHFGEAENENEIVSSSDRILDLEHPDHAEKLKILELERRDIIGEIVKLNPTYKVPSDYKPIMKEDRVPINLSEHPQHNVIAVILGSGSETVKRLEKETGAKVQLLGTRGDVEESVLINPGDFTLSDGNEVWKAYKELFFHVSADTFEKIDAAVALIELLVTPVPGNPQSVLGTPAGASEFNSIPSNSANQSPASSNAVASESITGVAGQENIQCQSQPSPWVTPALPITAHSASSPNTALHTYPPVLQPQMPRPGPISQPSPFTPLVSRPMIPLMRPFIPRPFDPVVSRPSGFGSRLFDPHFRPGGLSAFSPRTSDGLIGCQPSGPARLPVVDTQPVAIRQPIGPSTSMLLGFSGPTTQPGTSSSLSVQPLPRPTSSNFTFRPVVPHNQVSPVSPICPQTMYSARPVNSAPPLLPLRPAMPSPTPRPNVPRIGPPHFEPAPPRFTHLSSFRLAPPFPSGGSLPVANVPNTLPRHMGFSFHRPQSVSTTALPLTRPVQSLEVSIPVDNPVNAMPVSQQIYDPFSPTSVSNGEQNESNVGQHESDPEYENLMASVGVK